MFIDTLYHCSYISSSSWFEQNYRTQRPNHKLQDENIFYSHVLSFAKTWQIIGHSFFHWAPASQLEEYRCFPPEFLPLFPLRQEEEAKKTRSRIYRNPSVMRTRPRRQRRANRFQSRSFARLSFSRSMSFVVRRYPAGQFFCKQTKPLPKKISGKNMRKKVQVYSMRRA